MLSEQLFLNVVVNSFCVSCSTAVLSKAGDVIEPQVMTQIVTKAKEMGKDTASQLPRNLICLHFDLTSVLFLCAYYS